MANLAFEERQHFQWWTYGIVAALAGMGVYFAFHATQVDSVIEGIVATGFFLVAMFLLNALHLNVRVQDGILHARLGWVVSIGLRLPLSEIIEARTVTYNPFRNAGGWGIRFGQFEGQRCRFYTASGNLGVHIIARDRQYIVGSQRPDELLQSLESQEHTK